jgi:hypothetical protein
MPALLNEFLGTKFKIVAGYQGIATIYLAMERGEVDSLGITWGEFKVEKSDLIHDQKVRILVQSAPRAEDLADVPTVDETAGRSRPRPGLLAVRQRCGPAISHTTRHARRGYAALRAFSHEGPSLPARC